MRNDNMYEPVFARKENAIMNDMNTIKTIKTMPFKDFKTLTYLKIAVMCVSALAAIGVPIGLAVAAANNDNYLVPLVAMIVFILIFLLLDVSSVKGESEIHHDNAKPPKPNVNENCKQELQKSHEQLHHIRDKYDNLSPDLPHREALAQLHELDCALDDIKKELNAIEAKYSDPWSVDQLELENSFLDQIRDYVDDRRFKVISRTLLEAVLADEKIPVYLEACASSVLEKTLQNLERISETGFLYPKVCRLKDDGRQISVFSVLESERVVGDEVLTIAPPHACRSIIYYDMAGNVVSTVTTWTTGPFASLTDDLIIVHEGYRKRQMRETLSMDGEELDIDSRDTIENTLAKLRKRLATLTARQS